MKRPSPYDSDSGDDYYLYEEKEYELRKTLLRSSLPMACENHGITLSSDSDEISIFLRKVNDEYSSESFKFSGMNIYFTIDDVKRSLRNVKRRESREVASSLLLLKKRAQLEPSIEGFPPRKRKKIIQDSSFENKSTQETSRGSKFLKNRRASAKKTLFMFDPISAHDQEVASTADVGTLKDGQILVFKKGLYSLSIPKKQLIASTSDVGTLKNRQISVFKKSLYPPSVSTQQCSKSIPKKQLIASTSDVGTLENGQVLVFEKSLFPTDVDKHQCSLSIPKNRLIAKFLTAEEDSRLEEDRLNTNIPAKLIDPELREYDVKVRLQKVRLRRTYTIANPWKDIVKNNSLCAGSKVQLWASRRNGSELYINLIVEDSDMGNDQLEESTIVKKVSMEEKPMDDQNNNKTAKRKRSKAIQKTKKTEGDSLIKECQRSETEKITEEIKDLRVCIGEALNANQLLCAF